jgi:hypothetical protein
LSSIIGVDETERLTVLTTWTEAIFQAAQEGLNHRHNRDTRAGQEPIAAERAVNDAIRAVAPPERAVMVVPDAWGSFAGIDRAHVPGPLAVIH